MMLFLVTDVPFCLVMQGRTHGETAITSLPGKLRIIVSLLIIFKLPFQGDD